MEYLYGASIQGIQSVIFETGKLKEIRGASEIIEKICQEFIKSDDLFKDLVLKDEDFIIKAAGNIKFVTTDKSIVEKVVAEFPIKVAKLLPGISASQAVIELKSGLQDDSFEKLEKKLKIQRNCMMRTQPIGCSATKRSPRTGKPAYKYIKRDDKFIDLGTYKKIENSDNKDRFEEMFKIENKMLELPKSEDDICGTFNKNWIAICHADGNGLGKILIQIKAYLKGKSSKEIFEMYRLFSLAIKEANEKALKNAFDNLLELLQDERDKNKKPNYTIPFRPIILGGDDLTFICRADLAVPFLQKYTEHFEKATKEEFEKLPQKMSMLKNGLTLCAGIAFIKKTYPFHYGYQLAEELCGYAKKVSKKNIENNLIPSSLAFHKVHSSFHAGYDEIVQKELEVKHKAGKTSPNETSPDKEKTSLQFGPYSIRSNKKLPEIQSLLDCINKLNESDAPVSSLRNWLDQLSNKDVAEQILRRMVEISDKKENFSTEEFNRSLKKLDSDLSIEKLITNNKTPIYDILTLISVGKIACSN